MSRNVEFFHGTTAHLKPGDVVVPGGGTPTFPSDTDSRFAYATADESNAWRYAESSWHVTDSGIPRVYRVTPLGRHSKDPMFNKRRRSRGNFESDRRSKQGWYVEEEVPMPEHMGNPEEWK